MTKPTVGDLESMVQSRNETFQEYVERWLVTAKQAEHKLSEAEALRMVVRSTQPPLRDLLSIQNIRGFEFLIEIGARVENSLQIKPDNSRKRKLDGSIESKRLSNLGSLELTLALPPCPNPPLEALRNKGPLELFTPHVTTQSFT